MKKKLAVILLSYLSIYVVWGTTYFFIRMSVETMPVLFLLTFRWLIGGLFFIGLSVLGGGLNPKPSKKEVFNSLWLGLLLLLVSNGLVSLAEKTIDSYIAALVLSITPIGVAFFDLVLWKKRISVISLFAMVIGIAGVGLLLYDGRSFSGSLNAGILMVIIAMLSWSFGTSCGHRLKVPRNGTLNSGLQMFAVGACSLLLLVFIEPRDLTRAAEFSTRSWVACLYLTTMGAAAYSGFIYLIKHEPAIRIVSYCFVNPIIAVLLGILIGSEKPVPFLAAGISMVLCGLSFTFYGDLIFSRILEKAAGLVRRSALTARGRLFPGLPWRR